MRSLLNRIDLEESGDVWTSRREDVNARRAAPLLSRGAEVGRHLVAAVTLTIS